MESLRKSPSSFGLQPWKFIVVTDTKLRQAIQEAAWGQPQVTQASHLIVLTAKVKLSAQDVDEYIQHVADTRSVSRDQLQGYHDMILGKVNSLQAEEMASWASKQTYIAAGFLMLTAAQMEIDSCPMEGFAPQKVNEILKLDEEYCSTILLPVGYRAASDYMAEAAKVRYPAEKVIETK